MIELTSKESKIRLDRFLRIDYPMLAQGFIEKALRKGQIKLNKKKAKSGDHVHKGDVINLFVNLDEYKKDTSAPLPEVKKLADKLFKEMMLFSTPDILVINKPASLSVQGGSKVKYSIDDALQYLNSNGAELKIVHRIDKETSGILVIAKNREAAQKVSKAFEEGEVSKKYLAILDGIPYPESGKVEMKILKPNSKHFQKMQEHEDGKESLSYYQVLKVSEDSKNALVEFKPVTGRTHQIRVHAASLDTAIMGDQKYNQSRYNHSPHLMLHAYSIFIPKEVLGKEVKIKCPIPNYFFIKKI